MFYDELPEGCIEIARLKRGVLYWYGEDEFNRAYMKALERHEDRIQAIKDKYPRLFYFSFGSSGQFKFYHPINEDQV